MSGLSSPRRSERCGTASTRSTGSTSSCSAAGLTWRQATVLRAYAKYLKQGNSPFALDYIQDALSSNVDITRLLVQLFEARFDPGRSDADRAPLAADAEARVAKVEAIERAADPCPRRRRQPRPRPHPALLPDADRCHPAHQLLPAHRERRTAPVHVLQARAVGDPRPARTPAALRDLRLQPPRRGFAPALRRRRPRRAALVGPSRRLPHRGARAGQGADGQEHRHRPRRREGGVLLQAAARRVRPRRVAGRGRCLLQDLHLRPPRHHRQPRRRQDGAPARRRTPRRRRLLPRRRGRQGHRDLLRHRQRRRQGLRLLARRRVRLRRLGGLRPQGDGHHGAWRLGLRAASLPRDGRRLPERGLHRGRRGRHVRRRLRQRPAVLRAHPSRGGLRPPRHLHRPLTRRRDVVCRAQAAVRAAALQLEGLRHLADLRGRRCVAAFGEVDPGLRAGTHRAGARVRRVRADARPS